MLFVCVCVCVCNGKIFVIWTYHNFFQILSLQMVQRFKEVLFDIVIQGVLHVCHLSHRLSHLEQRQTWNALSKIS